MEASRPSGNARKSQLEEEPVESLISELHQVGLEVSPTDAARLRFLAERKYNRYDLYAPGELFESRLVDWLENFDVEDRPMAMEVVWALTYVSQYEMRAICTAMFQDITQIVESEMTGLTVSSGPAYLDSRQESVDQELSQALFVAMADDVLFDFFRRYAQMNCARITKDNFVEYYKLDRERRDDLVEHSRVFLIDQVSGSGFTAIRKEDGIWHGKLPTFQQLWEQEARSCKLYYCPYILAARAERHLRDYLPVWAREVGMGRPPSINPTCRVRVSPCLREQGGDEIDIQSPVARLCRKYHSRFIVDEHMEKGGPCEYGFGSAGLTLVLSTNCPNDTLPILWHNFNGWKPLFPRVRHHR